MIIPSMGVFRISNIKMPSDKLTSKKNKNNINVLFSQLFPLLITQFQQNSNIKKITALSLNNRFKRSNFLCLCTSTNPFLEKRTLNKDLLRRQNKDFAIDLKKSTQNFFIKKDFKLFFPLLRAKLRKTFFYKNLLKGNKKEKFILPPTSVGLNTFPINKFNEPLIKHKISFQEPTKKYSDFFRSFNSSSTFIKVALLKDTIVLIKTQSTKHLNIKIFTQPNLAFKLALDLSNFLNQLNQEGFLQTTISIFTGNKIKYQCRSSTNVIKKTYKKNIRFTDSSSNRFISYI